MRSDHGPFYFGLEIQQQDSPIMKTIRQLHFYLGVFFAPSIIFFAFTGALQTFSLHENKVPGSHHPEWIANLAEIHKDQRLRQKKPKPSPSEQPETASTSRPATSRTIVEPARHTRPTLPLKIFVLFLSVGLISTCSLGIYMAFKYNRDRRLIGALLIIGIFLPVCLLFLR